VSRGNEEENTPDLTEVFILLSFLTHSPFEFRVIQKRGKA